MFCGLCAQVCPVDAITMSREYELSVTDRDGLVYTKIELASIGAQAPIWWESGSGPTYAAGVNAASTTAD
jgi:NADH-quinone oxidoreductase subunit I